MDGLIFGFGMAALGAIVALDPRPSGPEHWWNVYSPPWQLQDLVPVESSAASLSGDD